MPSLSQVTIILLSRLAALRVSVKLARLQFALRKYGYDPSQPRVPAGSPSGGQWVDAGASTPSAARVQVAVSAFDNPGLYHVDLEQEDRKGGHGFSKHVAKSAGYLKAYVIAWNMNPANQVHPAEGSFHSASEANNLVSAVLRSRPDLVQAAIDGKRQPQDIRLRFGYDTGYEAFQPSESLPPVIRTTYWVEVWITHDPNPKGRGYRVITAYPMNELPNETEQKFFH